MAIIIPTILANSKEIFEDQIKIFEPVAKLVQIDICDGEFVPNKTFDPALLKEISTNLLYDLHLMVQNPGQVIEQLYDVSNINKIIFHIESVKFPIAEIEHIQGYGHKAWIAVNPEMKLDEIEGYVYEADGVLFLSVHPGKQAQELMPEVLEKIKEFKAKHPNIPVAIDGGVKKEHLQQLKNIGVEEICIGSAIIGEPNPAEVFKEFQKLAKT